MAPGPLVKRSDYFLDSHSLGEAVDFSIGEKLLSVDEGRKFVLTATDKTGFGMIVQYSDFFHADSRSGNSSYIDMTNHEPFAHSRNCSEFEFSQVDTIKVGHHKDNKKVGFIAAIVGMKIYLYEISAFTSDGFIEKSITVKSLKE